MKRILALFAVILIGLPALIWAFPVGVPTATGYNGSVKLVYFGNEFGLVYQDANNEIKYTSCSDGISFDNGIKVADGMFSALAVERHTNQDIDGGGDLMISTNRVVLSVNTLPLGYMGLFATVGSTVWPVQPTTWSDPWLVDQSGGLGSVGSMAPPAIRMDALHNIHVVYEKGTMVVVGPNAGRWVWYVIYQKYDPAWNQLENDVVVVESGSPSEHSPSLALDADGNPHIVWDRSGEIWYAEKKEGAWSPAYNLSLSDYSANEPNIDCYGNIVSVAWVEEFNGLGEVLLRRKEASAGYDQWLGMYPREVSNSPDKDSELPQVVGANYVTWNEQELDGNWVVKLAGLSTATQTISPAGENVYYPQSLFLQDVNGSFVYTAWTHIIGDGTYDVVSVKTAVDPVITLAAIVGGEEASPYTIERDGYLVYNSGIAVDYAATELAYSIPVNPENDYDLQIIGYHQSSEVWNELVTIDGKMSKLLKVTAHVPETLTVKIPKAYLKDGKVDVTIRRKTGAYAAIKAIGLMEYLPKVAEKNMNKLAKTPGSSDAMAKGEFKLAQNSPNPFKQSTTINYQVAQPGQVSLKVYNIAGQVVKTLVDGQQNAGIQNVTWDGKDANGRSVSAGVYVYRLNADGQTQVKRLTVLK